MDEPDYWRFGMPQALITSGPSLSPHYQCYLAALNVLDAKLFMLDERVVDWMDPSQPAVKGCEAHHLFPRAYLEGVLEILDVKRINQAANFAPTDWSTNIAISDDPPSVYWSALVTQRARSREWLEQQMYWHALPAGWEALPYEDFLAARRSLMAQVTRDGFEKLSGVAGSASEDLAVSTPDVADELSLGDLVELGLLRAGDLLDPVDPSREVDAVIDDEGTLVIDGVHRYDSLDEAARSLGVTNMSGLEFWALEGDEGVKPLVQLVQVSGRSGSDGEVTAVLPLSARP